MYPDEEAAKTAVCHLADNTDDAACQAHCLWVLEGFINSVGDCCDADNCTDPKEELNKALAQLKGKKRGAAMVDTSIDWKTLIKTVLAILLQILG
jgi:hypothetical protein